MSGPKTNRYVLSLAQMAALEQQRKKEMMARMKRDVEAARGMLAVDVMLLGSCDGAEQLMRECEQIVSAPIVETEAGLHDAQRQLSEVREKIKKATVRRKESPVRQTELPGSFSEAAGHTLDEYVKRKAKHTQPIDEPLVRELEDILSDDAAEFCADEVRQVLNQLTTTDNPQLYKVLRVSARELIKKIHTATERYENEQVDYELEQIRYHQLCEETGRPALPKPWTPGALEMLKAENDSMEAEIMKQREETYISETLDEVMREMGYNLLGGRERNKRGKLIRHKLYAFQNGTGIDVTYSDNGQIAMELGGLDTKDRLPDAAEEEELCEHMQAFCSSFDKIEQELKRRGVVLNERISHMPPEKEYAQIIDTEDYNLVRRPDLFAVTKTGSAGFGKRHAGDND